jgi:L-2-amino-thiazoline-4-carboxylic acid hydrolase
MSQQSRSSRRELLFRVLPACAICVGCPRLAGMAAAMPQKPKSVSSGKKYTEKTDMTWEELFKFAYGYAIPTMKNLSEQIGKEKFLEMLKKATSEVAVREVEETYRDQPKRDLATLLADMKKPGSLYQHTLTFEFVKDTEKEADVRITECLWARTFREAKAGDLGYAMICHGDIASTKAYNPKITLNRPKILMKGDDECRFHWVMEA